MDCDYVTQVLNELLDRLNDTTTAPAHRVQAVRRQLQALRDYCQQAAQAEAQVLEGLQTARRPAQTKKAAE